MEHTIKWASFGMSALLLAGCGTSGNEGQEQATVPDTLQQAPAPAPATTSVRPVHWGYTGDDGPTHWGTLNAAYALCGNGQNQSPIALTSGAEGKGRSWTFDYRTSKLWVAHNEHVEELVDNGHTIQMNVDHGSTLTLDGRVYHLKQFHVHTPSEHTLDGKNLPMEVHFVHQDSVKGLAVVSVLVDEGKANANLAKLIAHIPSAKGDTVIVEGETLDLKLHLPDQEKAFHYLGSLTTPPCSEQVEWLILKDHITASPEQIEAFRSRIGPNNRPVQALNTRTVENVDMSGDVK